jgi:hypothetical protein
MKRRYLRTISFLLLIVLALQPLSALPALAGNAESDEVVEVSELLDSDTGSTDSASSEDELPSADVKTDDGLLAEDADAPAEKQVEQSESSKVGLQALGDEFETLSAGYSSEDFIIAAGVLSSYTGSGGEVTIPDDVIQITSNAFKDNGSTITKLTIPASVKKIDGTLSATAAFRTCVDLTEVVFLSAEGDNVAPDLGLYTFYNFKNLVSAILPDNLTVIGNSMFYGCTALKNVELPSTLEQIGPNAFRECTSLTLTSGLPDALTKIDNYAFSGCTALTGAISLSRSIDYLGSYVFQNTGITTVIYNAIASGNSLGGSIFYGCTSLENVSITDNAVALGTSMFQGCTKLSAITIPTNITIILNSAFSGCSALKSITIPSSVTSIGTGVFSGCTSLTEVNIECAMDTLSSSFFSGCTSLATITLPDGLRSIGSNVFSGCTNLKTLDSWPTTPLTSIGSGAFRNTKLTSLTIAKETDVANDVFIEIENFTLSCYAASSAFGSAANSKIKGENISIILLDGDSVTKANGLWISDGVLFYYDGSGESVTIPESVTKIAERVFSPGNDNVLSGSVNSRLYAGTAPLTSVTFPASLTEIGSGAFLGSTLTSVIIPENVTLVGDRAFAGCDGLLTVTVNAKNIDFKDIAFRKCSNLMEFTSTANVLTFGAQPFDDCLKLGTAELSGLTGELGNYAFRNCVVLRTLVIPAGVTKIGVNAFSSCTALSSITFPSSITSIGNYALEACSTLESVTIPAGVTTIGNYVFRNCTNLKNVVILTPSAVFSSNALNGFPSAAKIYCKYGSTAAIFAASKSVTYDFLSAKVSLTANADVYTNTELTAYSGFAQTYGFVSSDASNTGRITVLDALLGAHLETYTAQFTPQDYTQYFDLLPDGKVTRAFGVSVTDFTVSINGTPAAGDGLNALIDSGDTIAITYEQTSPSYIYRYGGDRIYSFTARPNVEYTLTLTDGSNALGNFDIYITEIGNIANIFDAQNKINITNSNGGFTIKLTEAGAYTLAAKDSGGVYDVSYFTVAVELPVLQLSTLIAGGATDTLTELVNGKPAGAFLKKGVQTNADGFHSAHFEYEYHVNNETETVSFAVEVAPGYEGASVAVQVGDSAKTTATNHSAIPATLTGDTTVITLYVAYTEDGVEYEQIYTVDVLKSSITPHGFLLDLEGIDRTLMLVPNRKKPIANGSTLSVIHYQADEYADLRAKVEAGSELYLGNTKLAPVATSQTVDFASRLADVYNIRLKTGGTKATTHILVVKKGDVEQYGTIALTPRSLHEGVFTPDRVVEYKPATGQFISDYPATNNPLWGRTGYAHYLSLGGHGGYVTFEYDEPIYNDTNNPSGIDFIIFGNAFAGGSAPEPGAVSVSSDGNTWYDLAGSNHYELEFLKNQPVTLRDGTQMTSHLLLSDTFYPLTYFGYADTSASSIYTNADPAYYPEGAPPNPYSSLGHANLGDGFDLSWAVDANGKPVAVDAIRFIRVQNIMDQTDGAFGENSTEIGTVMRINPKYVSLTPVGVTNEPEILVMNNPLPEPSDVINGGLVKYYEVDIGGSGLPTVKVNGAASDNIFINTARFEGSGEYVGLTDSSFGRTIRVIVQNGEKEPRIYVIKCVNGSDPAINADLVSIALVPGDLKLPFVDGYYTATVTNNVERVMLTATALNFAATLKLDGEEITHGTETSPINLNVGNNDFRLTITSTDGTVTKTYPIRITRRAVSSLPQQGMIAVWFEFTGDDIHYIFPESGDKYEMGEYTGPHNPKTWIERQSVTVPTGSTVKYVTDMILMNAGIGFHTVGGTYIDYVQIPGTNQYLGEFDNGPNSGWMYRHNGKIANVGYAARVLQTGDTVLWFYTDDYTKEKDYENGNWGFDTQPDNGTSGNTDKPGAETPGDGTLGGGGGAETPTIVATETVETKPTVNADTGKATAAVETETVTKAVTDAKKAVADAKASGDATAKAEVKIVAKTEPATTGAAATPVKSVEVDIPAEAFKAVAESKELVLTVESDVSTLTLDTATLTAIAETAKDGETIKIAAEAVDTAEALNEKQQAKVGDNPVIEVNITVGTTAITALGGTVTVSVPYTPPATVAESDQDLLTVYYLDDDGNITEMKGAKYDTKTGKITFTTTHFSKFFVSEWINPFIDIAKGEWYYKAARYAYSNDLMTGSTPTTFDPQTTLTRAMLATILYRNAVGDAALGVPPSPETPFTDVPAGQWYTDAIAWASSNNLITGVGDNKFAPNDPLTREQFATLLYRYTKFRGKDTSKTADYSAYTDAANVSDWAREAMAWAYATNLVTGRTETTLAPEIPANRAEAAMLLQRYLETIA